MSQLTEPVAQAMSHGWLMGLTTAGFLTFFLGWLVYVALPSQSRAWSAMARMPLDDDERADGGAP